MECGTAKPHQFRRLWQIRKEPQYANRRLCSEASLAARGRCLIMESHQSSLWVAAVGSPLSFPHFQRCKTYTPGSSLVGLVRPTRARCATMAACPLMTDGSRLGSE